MRGGYAVKHADAERELAQDSKQIERLARQVHEADDVIDLLEHDQLTGLYSVRGFCRRAEREMADHPGVSYDAIVIDVGGMTLVNEVYGATAGNVLLRGIGNHLKAAEERLGCIFGRIYSSIFCAFARTDNDLASELFDDAVAYLERYPLQIHFEPRLGVYSSGGERIAGEQMLDHARLARSRANAQNGWVSYYGLSVHNDLVEEHRICDRVGEAIVAGEFEMYLQPKVDMHDARVVGAEALVRWRHPDLGFLSPGRFVPMLESRGLIYDVDRFMWEQICRFQTERRQRGLRVFPISVNVARGDLYRKGFVDDVYHLVRRYGLEMKDMRLEILERTYAADEVSIGSILAELRALGFKIEMDDFGTGMSSLGMLADMNVDVLKLDRSFLRSGLLDERRIEVIRAVVQLAHALGIRVTAEGVEHEHQRRALLSLGCNTAQGYLFYRPQPAKDFALMA